MEEGYFSVQLDKLQLALHKEADAHLILRTEIEIRNALNIFHFTANKQSAFHTEKFTPLLQESDESEREPTEDGGEKGPLSAYLYGFEDLTLQSNYIDLNREVLQGLANATIAVKVVHVLSDAPAAAPAAAPAKGKPAAPPAPTENTLFEVCVPFSTVMSAAQGRVDVSLPLADYLTPTEGTQDAQDILVQHTHTSVDLAHSSLSFSLFADHALAEHLLGGCVLLFASASLSAPPHHWALHAADVVDPKAKVPPTQQELRNKYIQNIQGLVQTQEKVAAYSLTVGGQGENASPTQVDGEEQEEQKEGSDTIALVQSLFPSLSFPAGAIAFDSEKALSVPVEEDIRLREDLWALRWPLSPCVFIQRRDLRRFVDTLQRDGENCFVPLTVRKTPSHDAHIQAAEGGERFATALLSLSALTQPDARSHTLSAALTGDGFTDSHVLSLSLTVNAPLVVSSQHNAFSKTVVSTEYTPLDMPHPTAKASNRAILQELRDEIALTIERIAQEYVSLYPSQISNTTSHANSNNPDDAGFGNKVLTFEERKRHFLDYLTQSGVFYELQEKLRPRLLLYVQERCGERGRALGHSERLRERETHSHSQDEAEESDGSPHSPQKKQELLQSLLSELYASIMKECTLTLNTLFRQTRVQQAHTDCEQRACVDDERETPTQAWRRLRRESVCCEADGATERAHTLHVERVRLLDVTPSLGVSARCVHVTYREYADFLLRRVAMERREAAVLSDSEGIAAADARVQALCDQAREALRVALRHAARERDEEVHGENEEVRRVANEVVPGENEEVRRWETEEVLAALHVEQTHYELAEEVLHSALALQLNGNEEENEEVHEFKEDSLSDNNSHNSKSRGVSGNNHRGSDKKHVKAYKMRDFTSEWSGYESDDLCVAHPRCHALLAAIFTLRGLPVHARKALLLTHRAHTTLYGSGSDSAGVRVKGAPPRNVVLSLCEAALRYTRLGLVVVANALLSLAKDCEAAAQDKARARNQPTAAPPKVCALLKRVEAEVCAITVEGVSKEVRTDAHNAACDAPLCVTSDLSLRKDFIAAKLCEAQSWYRLSTHPHNALESFVAAVQAFSALTQERASPWRQEEGCLIPLSAFVQLAKLLMDMRRYEDAIGYLLFALRWYSAAPLCRLLGECYRVCERLDDAEQALTESNMLDNRCALCWSALCLVLVSKGAHRWAEAEECLFQSLRLGLQDVDRLVELAKAFLGADRFAVAEDLLRRALAAMSSNPLPSSSSPRSAVRTRARVRTLLADVLAAQQQSAQAVEEYRAALSDAANALESESDRETQLEIAEKALALSRLLGRDEEIQTMQKIVTDLRRELF